MDKDSKENIDKKIAQELKVQLSQGYDIVRISNWAVQFSLKHRQKLDKGSERLLKYLAGMKGDLQSQYTQSEFTALVENIFKNKGLKNADLIIKKIHELLLNEWDPIGLKGASAQNQYEDHANFLYKLLRMGRSETEVFNYLLWIETHYVGLSFNMEKARATLEKILQIFKQLSSNTDVSD